MKDIVRAFGITLFLLAIGFSIGYFTHKTQCPGKGNVIVSQTFLDSLEIVAGLPPDTVLKEIIIYQDKPVDIKVEVPVPTEEGELNHYSDSLVNDKINIWNDIWVRGTIEKWEHKYNPVIKEITKEIYISKPVPVKYEVEVPQKGLYITTGIGYGFKSPLLSGEILYLTKKNKFIGVQTLVGKDNTAILFKGGIKLF